MGSRLRCVTETRWIDCLRFVALDWTPYIMFSISVYLTLDHTDNVTGAMVVPSLRRIDRALYS